MRPTVRRCLGISIVGGWTAAQPYTDFNARRFPEYHDAGFDCSDGSLADAVADSDDAPVDHGEAAIRRHQDGRDVRERIA